MTSARTLGAIFALSLLLSGCFDQSSKPQAWNVEPDGAESTFGVPAQIQQKVEIANVSAEVTLDGANQGQLELDGNVGRIRLSNIAPGSHTIVVHFYYDDNGLRVSLAQASKTVEVIAGQTAKLSILETDYVFTDTDNDGISNADEIDQGTNYNDINDPIEQNPSSDSSSSSEGTSSSELGASSDDSSSVGNSSVGVSSSSAVSDMNSSSSLADSSSSTPIIIPSSAAVPSSSSVSSVSSSESPASSSVSSANSSVTPSSSAPSSSSASSISESSSSVSSDQGSSSSDGNNPINQLIVEAGDNIVVQEGAPVVIEGRAQFTSGSPTYLWEYIGNEPFSEPLTGVATDTLSFTAGNYLQGVDFEFRLTVAVGDLSETDTVTVSVSAENDSPVVSFASEELFVAPRSAVEIVAFEHRDPENQLLRYSWQQQDTDAVKVESLSFENERLLFTAPSLQSVNEPIDIHLTLILDDGEKSSSAEIKVTVAYEDNQAPQAVAGYRLGAAGMRTAIPAGNDESSPLAFNLSQSGQVLLDATGSTNAEPEETLSYNWSIVSGDDSDITLAESSDGLWSLNWDQLNGSSTIALQLTVNDSEAREPPVAEMQATVWLALQGRIARDVSLGQASYRAAVDSPAFTVSLTGVDATDAVTWSLVGDALASIEGNGASATVTPGSTAGSVTIRADVAATADAQATFATATYTQLSIDPIAFAQPSYQVETDGAPLALALAAYEGDGALSFALDEAASTAGAGSVSASGVVTPGAVAGDLVVIATVKESATHARRTASTTIAVREVRALAFAVARYESLVNAGDIILSVAGVEPGTAVDFAVVDDPNTALDESTLVTLSAGSDSTQVVMSALAEAGEITLTASTAASASHTAATAQVVYEAHAFPVPQVSAAPIGGYSEGDTLNLSVGPFTGDDTLLDGYAWSSNCGGELSSDAALTGTRALTLPEATAAYTCELTLAYRLGAEVVDTTTVDLGTIQAVDDPTVAVAGILISDIETDVESHTASSGEVVSLVALEASDSDSPLNADDIYWEIVEPEYAGLFDFSDINALNPTLKVPALAEVFTATLRLNVGDVFDDIQLTVEPSGRPFITRWNAIDGTVLIPTRSSGYTYDYFVDWGDGSPIERFTGDAEHQYADAGEYDVAIFGDFPAIYMFKSRVVENRFKLLSVEQWGDIEWLTMSNAFVFAENMDLNAKDVPDLSGVNNMDIMFGFVDGDFDESIGNWDVSSVESMRDVFFDADNFNKDISRWNVSNVKNTSRMFAGADSFDHSLGDWDISSMESMGNMFDGVTLSRANYDATLIGWASQANIPSNIIFDGGDSQYSQTASAARALLESKGWTIADGGLWLPVNVDIPDAVIGGSESTFTVIPVAGSAEVSRYDWSNSTCPDSDGNPVSILENATNDTTGSVIFTPPNYGSTDFVCDIQVEITYIDSSTAIFSYALTVSPTVVAQITVAPDEIFDASFVFDIEASVTGASADTSFEWVTSNVNWAAGHENITFEDVQLSADGTTVTAKMRVSGNALNGIDRSTRDSDPNRIRVATLDLQVEGQSVLNEPAEMRIVLPFVTVWDTSITSAEWAQGLFSMNSITSQNALQIGGRPDLLNYDYMIDWGDSSQPELLNGSGSHTFNEPGVYTIKIIGEFPWLEQPSSGASDAVKLLTVKRWGDIAWKYMSNFCNRCVNMETLEASDAPDLSAVEDMRRMFMHAEKFNGDINHWNVSNIQVMQSMFWGALAFNQDLDQWNVSAIVDFSDMFAGAFTFDGDISNWTIHANQSVDMSNMFSGSGFGGDISGWNTKAVSNVWRMFKDADNFDHSLGDWDISSMESMGNMFDGVTLSRNNYDATLIGWASQPNAPSNISFDGGDSQYTQAAAEARALLESKGWRITDGGLWLPVTVETTDAVIGGSETTFTVKPVDGSADISRYDWSGSTCPDSDGSPVSILEGTTNDTKGSVSFTPPNYGSTDFVCDIQIEVTYQDGSVLPFSYALTVVPTIELSITEIEGFLGQGITKIELLNMPGSGEVVTFSSENSNVATVDQAGNVSLVGEGTTNIQVTVSDSEGLPLQTFLISVNGVDYQGGHVSVPSRAFAEVGSQEFIAPVSEYSFNPVYDVALGDGVVYGVHQDRPESVYIFQTSVNGTVNFGDTLDGLYGVSAVRTIGDDLYVVSIDSGLENKIQRFDIGSRPLVPTLFEEFIAPAEQASAMGFDLFAISEKYVAWSHNQAGPPNGESKISIAKIGEPNTIVDFTPLNILQPKMKIEGDLLYLSGTTLQASNEVASVWVYDLTSFPEEPVWLGVAAEREYRVGFVAKMFAIYNGYAFTDLFSIDPSDFQIIDITNPQEIAESKTVYQGSFNAMFEPNGFIHDRKLYFWDRNSIIRYDISTPSNSFVDMLFNVERARTQNCGIGDQCFAVNDDYLYLGFGDLQSFNVRGDLTAASPSASPQLGSSFEVDFTWGSSNAEHLLDFQCFASGDARCEVTALDQARRSGVATVTLPFVNDDQNPNGHYSVVIAGGSQAMFMSDQVMYRAVP